MENNEMTPQQKDLKKLIALLKKQRNYFSTKDYEAHILLWNLEDTLRSIYKERYE